MVPLAARLLALVRLVLTLGFLPARWHLPAYGVGGIVAGLGLLLVRVAEMPSYLSDSPRTCINCHIMRPQYATWERSSHRHATCNDCHVPHDSELRKYAFKAQDGTRHAAVFALRREPQVIRAIPASQREIRENCVRCHQTTLRGAFLLSSSGRRCADCHRDEPHGGIHGLSATPNAPAPRLDPLLPARRPGASQ